MESTSALHVVVVQYIIVPLGCTSGASDILKELYRGTGNSGAGVVIK